MVNPISHIEDEKAQLDIGVFGYRILAGALSEGATLQQAAAVVSAFFEGTARSNNDPPSEPEA